MRNFRSIKVWEKSHEVVSGIYQETSRFPKSELFSLTSQIRDTSSSIPSNIAEGCGKGSEAELARFLQIAMGSASELEYRILLARDLGYLPEANYLKLNAQLVEVKRMLAPFINKIRPRC
jgi:four helix bundle protein